MMFASTLILVLSLGAAIGMRASLMYCAARYAGVPARVNVGSFEDWQRQPGYPVVK